MFWPVMFEAASNVGPEGPLKKMPTRMALGFCLTL